MSDSLPASSPQLSPQPPLLAIGDRVCLSQAPAYFKTADPMPMLRPPDLIGLQDIGTITEQRAGQTWVVQFEQGSLLLDTPYLQKVSEPDSSASQGRLC